MKRNRWKCLLIAGMVAAFAVAAAVPGLCAPPKKWDRSADVVIVGAGGAGLAAAVTAAEKKVSVIVSREDAHRGRQHNPGRRRSERRGPGASETAGASKIPTRSTFSRHLPPEISGPTRRR